ncbi:unnamed protein product, partial [Amoebophrya sp. A25]
GIPYNYLRYAYSSAYRSPGTRFSREEGHKIAHDIFFSPRGFYHDGSASTEGHLGTPE